MKKTTTIIICYFIFTLFFVSGVFNFTPTLTEVYMEDPDKAMFLDQLTEHKLQPVNTIKAVGNDSLVENVYFIVEVDGKVVFSKKDLIGTEVNALPNHEEIVALVDSVKKSA